MHDQAQPDIPGPSSCFGPGVIVKQQSFTGIRCTTLVQNFPSRSPAASAKTSLARSPTETSRSSLRTCTPRIGIHTNLHAAHPHACCAGCVSLKFAVTQTSGCTMESMARPASTYCPCITPRRRPAARDFRGDDPRVCQLVPRCILKIRLRLFHVAASLVLTCASAVASCCAAVLQASSAECPAAWATLDFA